MSLYIGVNYHPHDWEPERWRNDIEMMKEAGFTTTRIAHLAWDSFEPREGEYTFEWFDEVMELFADAGIGVVIDLPMRPAPVWVHRLCPNCTIGGRSGMPSAPVRRYMEDVSDEGYRFYALRFAKKMLERYRGHRALFAWGLCNEQGSGFYSYSEMSRVRFSNWLRKRYGTVDALNKAWAAQRWSRRLEEFSDAVLPINETATGAPEPWLDMRRYFSDMTSDFLLELKRLVERESPGVPHCSNHYAERVTMGFDYLKMYEEFLGYPTMGYYPDYIPNGLSFLMEATARERIAESGKPMWHLEFRSGNGWPGGFSEYAPKGAIRSLILLSLLQRSQTVLGWTWRSMYAGEEKFIFGLLRHDGEPGPSFYEYKRAAADIKKLEKYAFPYLPQPEIGVSYSYPSMWITSCHSEMFKKQYLEMQGEIAQTMYELNREYNIVDLRALKGSYKLIVVPNQNIMTREEADCIRKFVYDGGTVIMTGTSAYMDENSKVFTETRPGMLADVFGIRIGCGIRTDESWRFTDETETAVIDGKDVEILTVRGGEGSVKISAQYYEDIELRGAESFAQFTAQKKCAVSVNSYGAGKAYYTAAEADREMLKWLIEEIASETKLSPPLCVPEGVQARRLCDGQYYYVNHQMKAVDIELVESGRGVLSGREYKDVLHLDAFDAELVVR